MYRPGELDQKLDFNRFVKVSDGMGGRTTTTELIKAGVWCKVRPLSGKESERFDKLNAEELTLFVVRYRTDIAENDQIVWENTEFNIRHIPKRSTRSMYSEFYAERGVAQ